MRLLQRKENKLRVLRVLLASSIFFYSPSLTLAEDENPYLNLSPTEANQVLNRLTSNPALLEKIPTEKREQLIKAEEFQKAISDQQQNFLIRRNISQVVLLKKLVSNLYAPESETRNKFESFGAFGERLEYLLATNNLSSLLRIRKEDPLSEAEKKFLDAQLITFLKSSVTDHISIQKSSEALDDLIMFPDDLWEQHGKPLLTVVFGAMLKEEATITSNQIVSSADRLKNLFETDPSIKPAALNTFETSIFRASDRRDFEETTRLLALMRTFFGERLPAPFLEKLLLEHGDGLTTEVSTKLIGELKERGELSSKFKFRLIKDGYFGPLIPILIALSIAFPTLGAIFFAAVLIRRRISAMQISVENPFKSKKPLPGYMRPVEVESRDNEDEYTRLLSKFNLSDSATENEIKRAYRTQMKTLHPDSGRDDMNPENSEEFRELKHAHDRILEIRAAWFHGRKTK
jgi:hypothetical protein